MLKTKKTFLLSVIMASAERYESRTNERLAMQERAKAADLLEVEDPQNPGDENSLERILGFNDLIPIRYLELGLKAARSVCRIKVIDENGTPTAFGTGSLISPSLLLTNNHVLSSIEEARNSLAEFDFEKDVSFAFKPVKTFNLEVDRFFYTNQALDFTLVAVSQMAVDSTPLSNYGHLTLVADPRKVLLNEAVTIIQHPEGKPKFIALRDNRVCDVLDDFVHYDTDTQPGSSGSPVFNDQWQVALLHHSGIPKRDSQKRILAKNGDLWKWEMGDDQIDWVANEGVRISSIVKHLKTRQDWNSAEKPLLAELGV